MIPKIDMQKEMMNKIFMELLNRPWTDSQKESIIGYPMYQTEAEMILDYLINHKEEEATKTHKAVFRIIHSETEQMGMTEFQRDMMYPPTQGKRYQTRLKKYQKSELEI